MKRAAIVDNREISRQWLTNWLESMGYEVTVYNSVQSCPMYHEDKELCSGEDPCFDVLITNYHFQKIDGLKFLKLQKQKNCNIRKMAIMSDRRSIKLTAEIEKLGYKLFHRPFHFSELNEWLSG